MTPGNKIPRKYLTLKQFFCFYYKNVVTSLKYRNIIEVYTCKVIYLSRQYKIKCLLSCGNSVNHHRIQSLKIPYLMFNKLMKLWNVRSRVIHAIHLYISWTISILTHFVFVCIGIYAIRLFTVNRKLNILLINWIVGYEYILLIKKKIMTVLVDGILFLSK